jgi:hypothetical protein
MATDSFRLFELASIASEWEQRAAQAEALKLPEAAQYRRAAQRARQQLERARAGH